MAIKVLKVTGILFITFIAFALISLFLAQKTPPPILISNLVDLDKIEKISRYRSCAGHVTVPQDQRETKRNMKHYFWVKPEYQKANAVELYAPFDGFVTDIRDEPELGLEGEIAIVPKNMFAFLPPIGRWSFSIQHIYVHKDLRRGSEVKAGDFIGYAASDQRVGGSFDVVYARFGFPLKKIDNWTAPFKDLDSIFNHMSDEVFAEYQNKGVASKEDFFISKEHRDQNPCQYDGEGPYFSNQEDAENWILL